MAAEKQIEKLDQDSDAIAPTSRGLAQAVRGYIYKNDPDYLALPLFVGLNKTVNLDAYLKFTEPNTFYDAPKIQVRKISTSQQTVLIVNIELSFEVLACAVPHRSDILQCYVYDVRKSLKLYSCGYNFQSSFIQPGPYYVPVDPFKGTGYMMDTCPSIAGSCVVAVDNPSDLQFYVKYTGAGVDPIDSQAKEILLTSASITVQDNSPRDE